MTLALLYATGYLAIGVGFGLYARFVGYPNEKPGEYLGRKPIAIGWWILNVALWPLVAFMLLLFGTVTVLAAALKAKL